jgi:hypothetical protein
MGASLATAPARTGRLGPSPSGLLQAACVGVDVLAANAAMVERGRREAQRRLDRTRAAWERLPCDATSAWLTTICRPKSG